MNNTCFVFVLLFLSSCKVFLGQLRKATPKHRVAGFLASHGSQDPDHIKVVNSNGDVPACAFIEFENHGQAARCIAAVHGVVDQEMSSTFVKASWSAYFANNRSSERDVS